MKLLRIHYGGLVAPLLIDFGGPTDPPKEQDSDSIIMLVITSNSLSSIHSESETDPNIESVRWVVLIQGSLHLNLASSLYTLNLATSHAKSPPAYGFILARCQSTNWMVRLVLMVATAAFTSFGTTSPEGSNGFQMNRTEDGLQVVQVYSVKPTPNLGKQKVWPEGQLQITEI